MDEERRNGHPPKSRSSAWRQILLAPGLFLLLPFRGIDPVAREFAAAFLAHALWFLAFVGLGLWFMMG